MDIISTNLHNASKGNAKPEIDKNGGGVHVISSRKIDNGDLIISSPAVALSFDAPYRQQRCSFCASIIPKEDLGLGLGLGLSSTKSQCEFCFIVSICRNCKHQGVNDWHKDSGECKALKCLVEVFGTSGGDHPPEQDNKSTLETPPSSLVVCKSAEAIDSSYLLVLRIMIRRWSDFDFDCGRKIKKLASPLPEVDWLLFDELYAADIGEPSIKEREEMCYLFRRVRKDLELDVHLGIGDADADSDQQQTLNVVSDTNSKPNAKAKGHGWLTAATFFAVMAKVLGCGHAITDVHAPLGHQCIGKAVFLEHSFYNHSCHPNAFLSCHIRTGPTCSSGMDKEKTADSDYVQMQMQKPALFARVHCIRNTAKGGAVSLSYIPTSGLDRSERVQQLYQKYNFHCKCEACEKKTSFAKRIDEGLKLPIDSDIGPLRQLQYDCNTTLLEVSNALKLKKSKIEDDDYNNDVLQSCISTIRMTQRGIRFQKIPPLHEVSIEAHRLLALGLSLAGESEEATKEHALFLEKAESLHQLFDPVALATSLLEYSKDMKRFGNLKKASKILSMACDIAVRALGSDHSFVRSIVVQHLMMKSDVDDMRQIEDNIESRESKRPNHH